MPTPVPESDSGSKIVLDPRTLRGIAHPVRVRLLAILRDEGPATASILARRLGLNTGATSYHLRQLATYGFVVDDPDRGTARERWWRSAHTGTVLPTLGPDAEGLGWAYLRSVAELYADTMFRAVDEMPTLPEDWREAATLSDYVLVLTAGELRDLRREVVAVIERYRLADLGEGVDTDAPPDAVRVSFQLQAFPRPGVLTASAAAPVESQDLDGEQ